MFGWLYPIFCTIISPHHIPIVPSDSLTQPRITEHALLIDDQHACLPINRSWIINDDKPLGIYNR